METNKLDLTNLQQYQAPTHHPVQYRRHNHLYKQQPQDINYTPLVKNKLAIDTPSTSNGITRIRNKINSIAQQQIGPQIHYKSPSVEQSSAPPAEDSSHKILSIKQIKDTQCRYRERAMSRGSVRSDRKLFVSISKSNQSASSYRNNRTFESPGSSYQKNYSREGRQKIRLSKYMQLKSNSNHK